MVRSAGFPVRGVLRLADLDLAGAVDELVGDPGEAFIRVWNERVDALQRVLGDIARSDQFRLAVTWQNHRILETGIDPFLRQVDDGSQRNRKRRLRELVVATYWQRFCVKNESIGFFGPTTWADVGRDGQPVSVRAGKSLTDRAVVFLENWPIDALARQLEHEFALGPWLQPRRAPFLHVALDRVTLPDGSTEPVDPLMSAVLTRADGTVLARDLVEDIRADFDGVSASRVYGVLYAARRRRWLLWKLEVPTSLRADEELRRILERIDNDAVRKATTSRVDRLLGARERIQRVWDDPVKLRAALEELEGTFVTLTGLAGTRHHGQTYGGRTLAYLECRRDLSIRLGHDFAAALGPLSLLLDSIRWLTWRIRQELEPHIRAAYRRIVGRGAHTPNAAMLWIECVPLLGRQLGEIVEVALSNFHLRWRIVLPYRDGESRVRYAAQDLLPAVRKQFDAPCAGWSEARLCSPDVMIAARSTDEVRAGAFTLVLGEIHAAMNSLDYCSMVPHHPKPGALLHCVNDNFPQPRLLVALPKESRPRFTVRSHPALNRDEDYRLAILPHTPLPRTGRVRFGADTAIVQDEGRLLVAVSENEQFDVMDLFAEALKSVLLQHFELFPGDHRPRITIDRLVMVRENWAFCAADLDFVHRTTELDRFTSARTWARQRDLPRHVFVKSSVEMKPFYVDFASPVYVELLVTAVRRLSREASNPRAARLTVSEMLPNPDHAWLPDAAGNRYTSEFRLVAFDARDARPLSLVVDSAAATNDVS